MRNIYPNALLFMMAISMRLLWWVSLLGTLYFMAAGCSEEFSEDPNRIHKLTLEHEQKIGKSIHDAFVQHLQTIPNKRHLRIHDHPAVYYYIQEMVDRLEDSHQHKSSLYFNPLPDQAPKVHLLEEAGRTGAFISPGGNIYIYTDLLKALDTEAQFVGLLAHLIHSSLHRLDVKKLERKFTINFLYDIALGANLSSSPRSGADLHAILRELEEAPYVENDVEYVDGDIELILCELDYNLRSYADIYHRYTFNSTGVLLEWCGLFPRTASMSTYATHLSDLVTPVSCNGQLTVEGYAAFKALLP